MLYEDRNTGRTPSEDTDRDGNGAAASQGTPRTAGHHHKLQRGKEGFHPESQREDGPADTLIWKF